MDTCFTYVMCFTQLPCEAGVVFLVLHADGSDQPQTDPLYFDPDILMSFWPFSGSKDNRWRKDEKVEVTWLVTTSL